MMKSRGVFRLTFVIAVGLTSTAAMASTTPYPPYPGFGNDPNGPALIIDLTTHGASIVNGPSVGIPYDGVEDTYVGIENTSGHSIFNLDLSGSNIFAMDGDGIAAPAFGSPASPVCVVPGTCDYAGPDNFFSSVADPSDGVLSFIGGLADGHSTYFSLEEPLNAASFKVTGVPIPAALPLLGGALVGWGALTRFRKRAEKTPA